ncbi:MAG: methyltransferase domain-containing protein [Chloroflexi bacterium]|nr:methyltransferase domain-containing protein [Chloroflexota bacterium]
MNTLTEREFYDRLAEFFDVMTDWQSRLAIELPFIETILAQHNARAILDCACGTGWHAIALTQRGYRVVASDASAQMIARARINAERERATIPFAVARFDELPKMFDARFDAVLCLGNSFVHVLDDASAEASFAAMRASLRAGGALILHNLNYDKRMIEKPRWFAVNTGTLDQRETLVWRFADYGEARITFNIALFTKNENAWSVNVQSTLQRPYQKSELENLLRRAGFREIAFYGNLKGEPFDVAQSGDLVIVATA